VPHLLLVLFLYLAVVPPSGAADPGTFTLTGGMSSARSLHTATLLGDGRVLVCGGADDSRQALGTAEIYDPRTATFLPTGSMGTARFAANATMLPDGRVLIVGGEDSNNVSTTSVELFNPATGTFSFTGSLLTSRLNPTVTLLGNGLVLVAGGYEGTSTGTPLASAEHAPPAHGLGSAVRCHARAAARSLGDRNPRAEFRRRFPADRVGPRVDGPGDHGGNRNGGRREHDTSRDDAAQLGAGGKVEHGHEQTRIGTDMMDHEAVAQGLDVVVEQNGHPVDLLAQFGAQFGVGGFMQMDNRDPRGSEQRADAPTDIGAPNDHNASHAHGCAERAVMRKLGGSTHGRTAG